MWCFKYAPATFAELDCHNQANKLFRSIAMNDNIPHLLIFGPDGAGKHTRIMCLIREIFKANSLTLLPSTASYTTPSKEEEINILTSKFHVELNPSDVGTQDVYVVQSVIKETASSVSVNEKFKVLVLQDADRLSFLAQQALRRLMELHSRTCKIILLASSLSGLIPPIRSRCFAVRVPGFSDVEIMAGLTDVARKSAVDVTAFAEDILSQIVTEAHGNMRKALLLLQVFVAASAKRGARVQDILPEWEIMCSNLVSAHIAGRGKISDVRAVLVAMLTKAVPANMIMKKIYDKAIEQICCNNSMDVLKRSKLAFAFSKHCQEYDTRLRNGSNPLYHLEAFVIATINECTKMRS